MFIYLIIIQHLNTGSKVKTVKGKNKKKYIIIYGDFNTPVPLVYIAKTRQKIIKDIKDLRKAVSHRVLPFMEHYIP